MLSVPYINRMNGYYSCGLFGGDKLKVLSVRAKADITAFKEYLMRGADLDSR
jgi:hypothetical protein